MPGLATLLSACSHMYVDESGNRHVIGLVLLTLPPADSAALGAESIRARSLGIALTRSPIGDALTVGYSDSTLTAIRNHSVVPIGDAAASQSVR